MTIPAKPHVGDIGTEFRVQVLDEDGTPVSVASATTRTIKFIKPGGTLVTKTALPGSTQNPLLTAANGYMHYLTVSTDLDVRGEWKIQGYVDIGVWKGHTVMTRFTVYPAVG